MHWNGQIQISTSRDVEVYGNTIEINSNAFGQGMVIVQQNRGTGAYGNYQSTSNYLHHNVVTVTGNGGRGFTGAAQDNPSPDIFAAGSNNKFDYNVYHMTSARRRRQ